MPLGYRFTEVGHYTCHPILGKYLLRYRMLHSHTAYVCHWELINIFAKFRRGHPLRGRYCRCDIKISRFSINNSLSRKQFKIAPYRRRIGNCTELSNGTGFNDLEWPLTQISKSRYYLTPSITRLQHCLHKCEVELAWLDTSINFSKSSCLHIRPRNDVVCATITSLTGHSIPWTSEIRYLGVYLGKFRTVKCSLDAAKRGFFLPGS